MPLTRSAIFVAVLAVASTTAGVGAVGVDAAPRQSGATATTVPLSADRVLFDSNSPGNYELFVMSAAGGSQAQLTKDAAYDSWWPKISPDRKRLVFYRSPAGVHDSDYRRVSLWSLDLATGRPSQLIPIGGYGWEIHGHAEWSPDGVRLAMFGGLAMNPQLFVTDTRGSNPMQVTSRGGQNLDPSWTPDGQSLLFVGCPTSVCYPSMYEVYRTPATGGAAVRLTNDSYRDHDPYTAPDGAFVAWLRELSTNVWAILRMAPDGSGQAVLVNDGGVNSKPAWSVDSSTIYFHARPVAAASFALYRIRRDGSGRTAVPGRPPSLFSDEYPVNSSS